MNAGMFENLAVPAVVLVILTGIVILTARDWRLLIGSLAAQYAGVFILVAQVWPVELAVVKLVAGWISASVLGMALASLLVDESSPPVLVYSEVTFRLVAAVLLGLVIYVLLPLVARWLPGALQAQTLGGLLLIGIGLLNLGFSVQPLRISLGLLSLLSGFEVLYAVVEPSLLMAGMLAVTNMGIALIGAYLILSPRMESEE